MPRPTSPEEYVEVRTPPARDTTAKTHFNDADDDKPEAKSTAAMVPLVKLFTFADKYDAMLMAIGTIGAIVAGVSQPIQIVLFGDILNSFNPTEPSTSDEFRDGINTVALKFTVVGAIVIVCAWSLTASRQAKRIRSTYVEALLSKEIGWFDVNEPMQLSSRVAESTVMIQEGMGGKVGDGIHFFSMALSGVIIGLIKGWELALVLLAFMPLIALAAFLSIRALAKATQEGIDSYAEAGAVAQESLSNIRTVHMFNAINHFIAKYEKALIASTQAGIKKGLAVGWGTGLMFFSLFLTYAVGLYYGALQIANDRRDECSGSSCYDGGRVLTVFFAIIMGALALGQASPSIQAIMSARTAAFDVFRAIEEGSKIDPLGESGVKLGQVHGRIDIQDVTFAYPSRPETLICSNYSLTIEAGETVAFVGPSGSGKSTVVSLLERFYDPLRGSVKLDGVDVRELNVKWLREQVGLVGQEPVLFATSIMENIRNGKPGASDEEVIQAAKMANAYTFIKDFPQGFETEVGERGGQLSGGQKQRIAIARAIIKNPPILLLDEATSALDTESERVVQESLDKLLAASKRTTIIVAHRLSTIRNANKIAVHSAGAIVELGTHGQLMCIQYGHYRRLVEAQNRHSAEDDAEDDEIKVPSLLRGDSTASASRSGRFSRHSSAAILKQDDDGVSTEDSESKDGDAKATPVSLARVWKLSLPEWKFLVLGAIGAVINAATFPVWGVLLTKLTVLFFELKPRDAYLDSARDWSLGFLGIGIIFGLSIIAQNYGFAVASQRLVTRVRLSALSAMLHQGVGWFDMDENSSGALVSRIATDSATLQAMTSDTLNQLLVNVTTLVISFAIAFFYSWEMTLVVLGVMPLMALAASVDAQRFNGTAGGRKKNDADTVAGSLLSEAIGSIRTIASFSMESTIRTGYSGLIDASKAADIKAGVSGGVTFGVAQGSRFFVLALMFYIGGIWVADGRIDFEDMYMVVIVIMLGLFPLGMTAQGMQDQAKVKKAAARVFAVIDRTPAIDSTSASGKELPHVSGDIEFRDVAFTYPARPDAQIYTKYNLRIKAGQTVALVGASGSGKSTAISLVERFYDPSAGAVTLDGNDLRSLNLAWLRERVSLVSQEPVLFAGTIADNIAMGMPGASRDEIIEAAKKANAYGFISNFPSGFDTDIGDRGAQVSGGQKQRIAIARAILRDPSVLLLDEATSALDNESERIVQASLDELLRQKKRTTIIVAHRLTTIRNADLIAVTKDGEIVEQGNHDQLLAIPDGIYKALVSRQTTGTQ